MITPVKRKTLSQEVTDKIKSYIIENSLGPGDRLPTEQGLADLFGVSRNSVREATAALGFLGIIRSAPKRGLTLGTVDMRRVTQYLGFHFALNDYSQEWLLKTRIAIEMGALPETMQRVARHPQLCDRLIAINNELEQTSDPDEFIEKDIAFHQALLETSDVEPLVAFGDLLQIFFKRFRQSVINGRAAKPEEGIRSHRKIIEAVLAGDLNEAQSVLHNHLEHHKGRL